jgi:hypothetical protein
MIAINPPVLVPPIRSKYLYGFGVSVVVASCSISVTISVKSRAMTTHECLLRQAKGFLEYTDSSQAWLIMPK